MNKNNIFLFQWADYIEISYNEIHLNTRGWKKKGVIIG